MIFVRRVLVVIAIVLRCWNASHWKSKYDHSNPTARIKKVYVKYGFDISNIAIGNNRTEYRTKLTEEIKNVKKRGCRSFSEVQRRF